MTRLSHADRQHLADLIQQSLHLADTLGLSRVGIDLNDALERLSAPAAAHRD